MNEEEYVEAYKDLPGLNERYVRALFRHNRGLLGYQDLLYAYETTEAHKNEVRVQKPGK